MIEGIRAANTYQDAYEISTIRINGWRASYRNFIPNEIINTLSAESDAKKLYKDMIKGQKLYVYEEDKNIKGYVWVGNNKKQIELNALYVNPTDKFRGIGTKLIKFSKEESKKLGFNKLILWCFKENTSGIRFFEKHGGKIKDDRQLEINKKLFEQVCFEFDI